MKKKIIVLLTILTVSIQFQICNELKAQGNDSYFYNMETERAAGQNSINFNNFSSPDANGFGFDEFSGAANNGINFNNFISNQGDGFFFDGLDATSNNTPLGSGLAVLSVLSILYLGRKKKEE